MAAGSAIDMLTAPMPRWSGSLASVWLRIRDVHHERATTLTAIHPRETRALRLVLRSLGDGGSLGLFQTPRLHHQTRRSVSAHPLDPRRSIRPLGRQTLQNPDHLQRWALSIQARRGHNRAAIALANKLAPIAWTAWTKNTTYHPRYQNTLS
jgi:hypothetical protein